MKKDKNKTITEARFGTKLTTTTTKSSYQAIFHGWNATINTKHENLY